jgi:hypothetical protein
VSLALIEKCLAGRSTIKEKAIQALLLLAQIGALEPVLVRPPYPFYTLYLFIYFSGYL